MKNTKKQTIKMNLSLEKDFYGLLQKRAREDYVKVSTWTKQFLMRNLLDRDNGKTSNGVTKDDGNK